MATQGQFYYFLACVFLGLIGGIGWELFSLPTHFFSKKKGKRIAKIVTDSLFFVTFAVVCSLLCARLEFPDHRIYAYAGYLLGLIIYYNTLRITLAFLKKVCYNTLVQKFSKRPKRKGRGKEEV